MNVGHRSRPATIATTRVLGSTLLVVLMTGCCTTQVRTIYSDTRLHAPGVAPTTDAPAATVALFQWKGGSPIGGGSPSQFEIRVTPSPETSGESTLTAALHDTRDGTLLGTATLHRLGSEFNNAGERASYTGSLSAEALAQRFQSGEVAVRITRPGASSPALVGALEVRQASRYEDFCT